jgi:hypothetical protein
VKTWQLADLAEWIGTRPSHLLRLPETGFGDADCLDFDFAVRALKRWADRRADETTEVADHSPERDPKKRMKTVPKYPSLLAVLGLDEDAKSSDPVIDDEVTALMAAMMSTANGWEGFGRGL